MMAEINIFDPELAWETTEAQVQKMEDKINFNRLQVYNQEVENFQKQWGTNANAPRPPIQPEKITLLPLRKVLASENGMIREEGPELLGELYVSPKVDRPFGKVVYGPFAPEFSHGSKRVHNDSNSNVPVGHKDTARGYVLVEHDNGQRYWYPVS